MTIPPATVSPYELAPGVEIGGLSLTIIAGPCVIEDEATTLETAEILRDCVAELGASMVFKASYDKANRSSIDSFRGPGLREGLRILERVSAATSLPILTDVHLPRDCAAAAEVCEVLQVPAFLCRQTDLLLAAGETGRSVNIKKGQFMAPEDMLRAVDKVRSTGNDRISVTERGASFGYHNLVVDMRSIPLLQAEGIPVIFDATHSLQLPAAEGDRTGGLRQYAEPLARAAVGAGASGVYMEVHPDPESALSDAATQLPPDRAKKLLADLLRLRSLILDLNGDD